MQFSDADGRDVSPKLEADARTSGWTKLVVTAQPALPPSLAGAQAELLRAWPRDTLANTTTTSLYGQHRV